MNQIREFVLTAFLILSLSNLGLSQIMRLSAEISPEEFSNRGAIVMQDNSCNEEVGDDFSLRIASAFGLQGSILCIPVTANNFIDIFSVQTGVSWDPSVLRFTEIRDSGLQSVNVSEDDKDQGRINVLWLFNQSSISLANGSTLFKLCFEVIGNSGQTTNISFVDNQGFPIEIANESGTVNSFSTYDALFTVGEGDNLCGSPTVFIIDQIGEIERTGVASQQHPELEGSRLQSADDFIIPPGPDLVLENVFIQGFYFNPNPNTGRNCGYPINIILEIYTNSDGLPESLIYNEIIDGAMSDPDRDGTFNLELTNKPQLSSWSYWLSVMQEMPFSPCGQFAWRHSTVDLGSHPIAFQDPDNIIINTCETWEYFSTCSGEFEPFSSLAFSMEFSASPKIVPSMDDWSVTCLGLLLLIVGVVAIPHSVRKVTEYAA